MLSETCVNDTILCELKGIVKQTLTEVSFICAYLENVDALLWQKYIDFSDSVLMSSSYILLYLFLHQVVSKGMQDEYPLWEKRTIIPPPWETVEVLKCLCHHWLPICGDFVPSSIKLTIETLRDFFEKKTKRMAAMLFTK